MSDNKQKNILKWSAQLTMVLIAVIGFLWAKAVWMFVTPSETLRVNNSGNAQASISSAPSVDYGKQIAAAHIFGKIDKTVIIPVKKPKTPVKPKPVRAKLNVKVQGIFFSKIDRSGRAILDANNKQRVYAVGDSINDNDKITISQISPRTVTINNQGKEETFELQAQDLTKIFESPSDPMMNKAANNRAAKSPLKRALQRGSRGATPVTTNLANTIRSRSRRGAAANNAPPPSEPEPEAVKKTLSMVKQKIESSPQSLMEIFTAREYKRSGMLIGFQIFPGAKRQDFFNLGFKPGDIVTQINGIALNNKANLIPAMNELKNSSSFSLSIDRNGTLLEIAHSL